MIWRTLRLIERSGANFVSRGRRRRIVDERVEKGKHERQDFLISRRVLHFTCSVDIRNLSTHFLFGYRAILALFGGLVDAAWCLSVAEIAGGRYKLDLHYMLCLYLSLLRTRPRLERGFIWQMTSPQRCPGDRPLLGFGFSSLSFLARLPAHT